MSPAKFLWLRAIAAIGLQWRKVTVCIYGPVECRTRQGLASETRREANAWALKTRQTEGPRGPERRKAVGNVGKPSETKRREAVGKIRKPSETSGSHRKRREAVGKIREPSETSGSHRKRREAVDRKRQEDVGKPSETSESHQKRREAVGKPSDSFQKPRNASMSENAVGKQMSESRPRSVFARKCLGLPTCPWQLNLLFAGQDGVRAPRYEGSCFYGPSPFCP